MAYNLEKELRMMETELSKLKGKDFTDIEKIKELLHELLALLPPADAEYLQRIWDIVNDLIAEDRQLQLDNLFCAMLELCEEMRAELTAI